MTNDTVTVLAYLRATPGAEKEVEQGLRAVIVPTRTEKGCINSDLHVSPDDPGLFLIHENWKSEGALQDHLMTPHVQEALDRVAPLLTRRADITRWKRID